MAIEKRFAKWTELDMCPDDSIDEMKKRYDEQLKIGKEQSAKAKAEREARKAEREAKKMAKMTNVVDTFNDVGNVNPVSADDLASNMKRLMSESGGTQE